MIAPARRRIRWEIAIVLSCSLIPSALYAVLNLLEILTGPQAIGESSIAINEPTSQAIVFDTLRRAVRTFATLALVALVIWLLTDRNRTGFSRIGLGMHGRDGRNRLVPDIGRALLLAVAIGGPGLLLYAVSRMLGATVQVVAGDPEFRLATVIALLLAAIQAACIEEIVVVGYLANRLHTLGWSVWAIIAASALLRGSYHLYQGVPMALGNVVMGIVFALAFWYWRTPARERRVLPLVIAHLVLDAVAFIGYPLARQLWPEIF